MTVMERGTYFHFDTIRDDFDLGPAGQRTMEGELCDIYEGRRRSLDAKAIRMFLENSKRASEILEISMAAAKHVVGKRGPMPGHRKRLLKEYPNAVPWPESSGAWVYCIAGCVQHVHRELGMEPVEPLSAKWCRSVYVAQCDEEWSSCYGANRLDVCGRLGVRIIERVEREQRTKRNIDMAAHHAEAMDRVLGLPPLMTNARPNGCMLAAMADEYHVGLTVSEYLLPAALMRLKHGY